MAASDFEAARAGVAVEGLAVADVEKTAMDVPTCQEPRPRCFTQIHPGLSWRQEFPCGRSAVVWHNERLMCRSCRRHALRSEARERRAAEGGLLGALVNAAPKILVVSYCVIVFGLSFDELKIWEKLCGDVTDLIRRHGREYAEVAYLVLLWVVFKTVDARLARTWSRRRPVENGERLGGEPDRREIWE